MQRPVEMSPSQAINFSLTWENHKLLKQLLNFDPIKVSYQNINENSDTFSEVFRSSINASNNGGDVSSLQINR